VICTGQPNRCQCNGSCPMERALRTGVTITPMNEAARRQAAGDKTAPSAICALHKMPRFLCGCS
jgi:hypothetical protein